MALRFFAIVPWQMSRKIFTLDCILCDYHCIFHLVQGYYMARIVKGGLIQTTLALSSEQPIEAIKNAAMAGQQCAAATPLHAGGILRSVLLCRTKEEMVRARGKNSGWPDNKTHAGGRQEIFDGHRCADL